MRLKKQIQYAIFKVKADTGTDIYKLFCLNSLTEYGIADIPNYKTSCFMNGLFRNIKENQNLDLLEESDNEDEFENISESKYVDLDREIIMQCVYNRKLNRWMPVCKKNNCKVNTKGEILILEKK